MHPAFGVVNWTDGSLQVEGLRSSEKKLGQLKGIFRDQKAWNSLDPDTIVYRVWWWEPVASGTEGGLFWGLTELQPGRVGNEYYMTHGHRHSIRNRAEFYGTMAGSGMLVLRDNETGEKWSEPMTPGSLHYVRANVTHRMVNTGPDPLRSIACWPSDAGHDYDVVFGAGFGSMVIEQHGKPVFQVTE